MTNAVFTQVGLVGNGFAGWVPFQQVRSQDRVPRAAGVYVVVRTITEAPKFLAVSPGGRFKGKDPTVGEEVLSANWVRGAEVVYIGKADELRRRLRQYADFGEGKPTGHWGGRLIWQLADSEKLVVAWTETPGQIPRDVEKALLAEFRAVYSQPPFANDPHLLGR